VVAVSLDFANLESQIKICEKAGVDILHLDIMDGHFVPNITFGPPVVNAINNITNLPLDCHLMIENPDFFIPAFIKAGADMISVHVETVNHLHRTLSLIKENGAKAGIALNPITPLEYAFEAAEFCDYILLMSVNPGFGGQSFISSFLQRAKQLREFLDNKGLYQVEIEIDGGAKVDNVKEISEAGANLIVSGSGLFKGNIIENTKKMRLELK